MNLVLGLMISVLFVDHSGSTSLNSLQDENNLSPNHKATVRVNSSKLKPSQKYDVKILLGKIFTTGTIYRFPSAVQIPPRNFSVQCNKVDNYVNINFTHLNEETKLYTVFITQQRHPLLRILCSDSVNLTDQETQMIHMQFKSQCFQCGKYYYVNIRTESVHQTHIIRSASLFIPCNPVVQQKTEDFCVRAKPENISSSTLIPTTSRSTPSEVSKNKGLTATVITIIVLFFLMLFIGSLVLFRHICGSKNAQKQYGLVICFPHPMEHSAAVKELAIMLNSYTSLHVRSSNEIKLKRNQFLKKQIQHVYDYFNTFIIVHSDGLYYHSQNEEKNGIGQEMADFTIELVKFCTKDNINQSKNIFHVTFEDLSNFENSQLCSDSQENMYYLYRPNVLANNNSLDLNQIENLLCDINDQQSAIQPSRYYVKFQMNWKESREIQNLNDALVSRDYKQRMFPNWYTDMFPKSEINDTLSNFSFDKNSKVSDGMSFEVYKNNTFTNSRPNGSDSVSYTVSETGTDQISVYLERINERNDRNVQSTIEC
ncbi:uncharacterized protein LOC115212051 isoform X2 [Octopus sinensis]|uniref:Uncharacterized protein LOC115212051 isoform X2 n=1 Tax=Octopus sinensis TaxID=2607531 RepID=A0A7E6EVX0_9MOLL|nr:uncharacterized protein LOC115212051 isoform X2 [Octopus sinensis]